MWSWSACKVPWLSSKCQLNRETSSRWVPATIGGVRSKAAGSRLAEPERRAARMWFPGREFFPPLLGFVFIDNSSKCQMKLSLGEGEAESCSANTASRLDLNLAAASRIMTALGGQAILSPNCCFCLLPCWSPCRIISFFLCELGGAAAEGPLDHPDSKQNTAANNPLFPPLLSLPCCGRNVFHL